MFVHLESGKIRFTPRCRKPNQLLDLLQLSRKELECKITSQRVLREFKIWKQDFQQRNDPIPKFQILMEGMLMRRRAKDAVSFYRIVRKNRMRAFSDYIERLPM